MNREMRRRDRAISNEEALAILKNGEFGVLSTVDENGLPYGVPLSYVVIGMEIFFHCAHQGRKIDNIKFQARAHFCVVNGVQAVYDNDFSTFYESVMAYGGIREVTATEEKNDILLALAQKYLPAYFDKAQHDINRSFKQTAVYGLKIEKISGKAKRAK